MSVKIYLNSDNGLVIEEANGVIYNRTQGDLSAKSENGRIEFSYSASGASFKDYAITDVANALGVAYGSYASIISTISDFFVDAAQVAADKLSVDLGIEVQSRTSEDANLQNQINTVASGYLGAIAYNASAPTPAKNGWYDFSTGGVVSWLTGAPTVKIGDRVSVVYAEPSSYTYTHVDVGSAFLLKTAQTLSSGEELQVRQNIGAKHAYQVGALVNAPKIALQQVGWYNIFGVYTAQSGFYSSMLTPIVGQIYCYAPYFSLETLATICFFNASGVFVGFFKAPKAGYYLIDEVPATATQYTFTAVTNNYTYWCKNGVQQSIQSYIDTADKNIKVADPNFNDYPLTWIVGSYYNATTGATVAHASYSRTGLIDISSIALSISVSSYYDNVTIANVIYFRADGSFLTKDTSLTIGTMYSNKTLYYPNDAAFVAFTKVNTVPLTAVSSEKINITELPSRIAELSDLKYKLPTFNYFIDYNLLSIKSPKKWVDGDYNGLGKDTQITSLGLFSKYGFGSEINSINTTASTANKLIHEISKFRNELKTTLRINYHFFVQTAISGTYSIQLYNNSTPLKTIPLLLDANKPKEVSFFYDFPVGFDFTVLNILKLYSFGQPANSTLYISPLEIWDGLLPKAGFLNRLSVKEANILKDSTGYLSKISLFIGDSISTNDNYYWKGFLANNYGLNVIGYNYLQEYNGTLPAAGGIKVIPPIGDEIVGSESIWYRCSRMAQYNADVIFLFGGINDTTEVNANLTIGLSTDIAYLDTTPSRPSVLTYAACLKGCIDMLKRDNPLSEIILITVHQCGVANTNYGTTGLQTSRVMSTLQMKIAYDYGLKCVPFYDCSGITFANYQSFLLDAVHPNKYGATRLANCVAETLSLR